MCLQIKRKKHMYLSMCSCCNIVSEYSSVVKQHLKKQHCKQKTGPKLAIPIRIESRFVKIIKKSLDKRVNNKISKKSNKAVSQYAVTSGNELTRKSIKDNKKQMQNYVLCTICKKKFEDIVTYLKHMSAKDHRCVEISFKCTECSYLFPSIIALLNHNKLHTNKTDLDNFKLERVSATDSNFIIRQCPYCVNELETIENLYVHIGSKHASSLESTKVMVDSTNEHENQEVINILSFNCKYCSESLHRLTDLLQHVSDKHPTHYPQPTRLSRKRKLPKWLADSNYVEKGSKVKKENKEAACTVSEINTSRPNKVKLLDKKSPEKKMTQKKLNQESAMFSAVVRLERCDYRHEDTRDCNNSKLNAMKVEEEKSESNYVLDQSESEQIGNVLEEEDKDEDLSGDSDDDFVDEMNADRGEIRLEREMTAMGLQKHFTGVTTSTVKTQGGYTKETDRIVSSVGLNSTLGLLKSATGIETSKNYNNVKMNDKMVGTGKTVRYASIFKCPFCPFYLYHRDYVYSHIQRAHPEVLYFTTKDVLKETLVLTENDTSRESFICKYCKHTSSGKNMFLHHVRTSHPERSYSNIPCILPFSQNKNGSSGAFTCSVCTMSFEEREGLEMHTVERTSGTSLKPYCVNSLPEPAALPKLSKKLVSWLCPYCDLVFTRKDSVQSHIGCHVDTKFQKAPIIKCFLVKPHNLAQDETENVEEPDLSHTMSSRDKSAQTKDEDSDSTCMFSSKSKLKNGIFRCQICDNFQTSHKEQIVLHMEETHRNRLADYEVIYVLEAFLERKESESKGSESVCIKCMICDYSSDNLTDAVRHSRNVANHAGKQIVIGSNSVDEIQLNGVATLVIGSFESDPLFEIISIANQSPVEEVYKCWLCKGETTSVRRRYLKDHIERYHSGTDMLEISLVMNDMINTVAAASVKSLKCTLCTEQVDLDSELIHHFQLNHPDSLPQLSYQIATNLNSYGTDCQICHVRCSDQLSLRRHLLLHINRHRIHCPTCGIYLNTSAQVAAHARVAHSKSSIMCNICGKIFMKNKDFLRHMRGHNPDSKGPNSKSLCQHCGVEVVKHSFKRHLIRFHSAVITCDCEVCTRQMVTGEKKAIWCSKCDTVVCSPFMLKVHNKNKHSVIRSHKDMHNVNLIESRCEHCNMVFENETVFYDHDCQDTADTSTILDDIKEPGMELDMTDIKERITADTSSDVIAEKYLQFTGNHDLPYMCRICHKSFRIKKYLYNHVRRQHSDENTKRFRCKICKMAFTRKNALKRHCLYHLGQRPHECSECQRSFKTASQLKEHMLVHTDQQNPQLTCRYCERKFIQNGALMSHIMHHCQVKPFICRYCKKGFCSSGELRRHMDKYLNNQDKTGSTHVCSYCKRAFPNKHFLINHFYKHGPQNPFECVVCQMRFRSFSQLYSHKNKTDHFTKEEVNEAKADLKRPYGTFKPNLERKELWNKRKVREGDNIVEIDTSLLETSAVYEDIEAAETILEDQNYVEVEVPKDAQEIVEVPTKVDTVLTEESVLQSMYDIDEKGDRLGNSSRVGTGGQVIVKYENEIEYTLEELVDYPKQATVIMEDPPETAAVMEQESYQIENVANLASLVAHNIESQEDGQTQVFQTPDGSVIHVCVIKPPKE